MDVSIVVTAKLEKNDIERARTNSGIEVALPTNIKDYSSAKVMVSVVQAVPAAKVAEVAVVAAAVEPPVATTDGS